MGRDRLYPFTEQGNKMSEYHAYIRNIILLLVVLLIGCKGGNFKNIAQDGSKIDNEGESVYLGSEKCLIDIYENDDLLNGKAVFVALHENETTCIAAFYELNGKNSFKLVRVRQSGKRLLKGSHNGKSYYFDPNRIFSISGIESTLKTHNKNHTEKMIVGVKECSGAILKAIKQESRYAYIIALHNNTDGAPFSINTYQNSSDAVDVFISDKMDPDNFFLTTKREDFNFFREHRQNVVLQSKNVTDDGSLSVFCQKKNIPYINIEAQSGMVDEQKEMIQLCVSLMETKK